MQFKHFFWGLFLALLFNGWLAANETALQKSGDSQTQDALRQQIESWRAGYPAEIQGRVLKNAEKIATFYEQNQFNPLWLVTGEMSASAQSLIEVIFEIGKEGLRKEDYHSELLTEPDTLKPVHLEFLLTDAFVNLTSHVQFGKINPETLTPDWKVKKKQMDTVPLLSSIKADQSVAELIQTLRPTSPRYYRLIDAYQKLSRRESVRFAPLALSPAIKKGKSDPRIPQIRKQLLFWGDFRATSEADVAELDSVLHNQDSLSYDEQMHAAVIRFQTRHGLKTDGVIGKDTLTALNVTVEDRLKDMLLNMERWRWLDQNMGHRFLVVNIADFNLRIFQDNEVVFEKPVIVGRNFRKTPVFSDKIRYLVLNPTWTVPKKLAIEDKLPEIKKDPDYLSRLGFTRYKSGTSTVIDPSSVEWRAYNQSFPFKIVQSPGPLNALGQVKFMFPNPYDVYLHDTPARDLFNQTQRAFSSGCIRVADSLDLAAFLLKDQDWTRERIDETLASKKTETVYLKTPLPIHIEYWTSWVDREGNLHFRSDLYERNAPLWNALQKPL